MKMNKPIIQVTDLTKYFPIERGLITTISSKLLRKTPRYIHAVNNVSIDIFRGETLGLVGESGSGKSTLGKCIIRLYEPTSGKVLFDGIDLTKLSFDRLKVFRRKMQMIFQDPYSSLNPRKTVGSIITHMLRLHKIATGEDAKNKAIEILELVGLSREHYNRYPHQFSGGQRQRIAIARAISTQPEFIIADEPVSALDVSIQSQILNLLLELKKKFNLTYLFISHDLGVVKYMSDRVAIMYLGKIVELGPTDELYLDPLHPYTQALISAIPVPDPDVRRNRIILKGEIPDPINPPTGCIFHTRCPYVFNECKIKEPKFIEIKCRHYVACHLLEKQ